MSISTNEYVDFITGRSNSLSGFYISEFFEFTDEELENKHDFIQWVFPLAERSIYNPNCPVIDILELYKECENNKSIKETIIKATIKMLLFWGIEIDHNFHILKFDLDRIRKLNYCNHNTLRFSRVLRCLIYHSFAEKARNLLDDVLTDLVDTGYIVPGYNNNHETFWEENYRNAFIKYQDSLY